MVKLSEVLTTLQDTWKVVRRGGNAKSITRLAKESIMQFPLVVSDGIEGEESTYIAKNHERLMASMTMIYLTTHNTVDLTKYDGIGSYLKTLSNDSAIPDTLKFNKSNFKNLDIGGIKGFESIFNENLEAYDMWLEPFPNPKRFQENAVLECWMDASNVVDERSLNEVYTPFKATEKALETYIDNIHEKNLKVAMENKWLDAEVDDNEAMRHLGNLNKAYQEDLSGMAKNTYTEGKNDKDPKYVNKDFVKTAKFLDKHKNKVSTVGTGAKFVEARDSKFSLLEPTIVACDFLVHGGKEGRFLQPVQFGVKSMMRIIPSNAMVSNMIQCLVSKNVVFKFIKWQKSEVKFAMDLLTANSDAKQDAMNNKTVNKIFSSLMRKKNRSRIGRMTGANIPVTTSFIITSAEAEEIKRSCGIDLTIDENALDLMNKLFIIGFGIYDGASKTLAMMYDGYSEYQYTQMSTIKLMAKDSEAVRSNDMKNMFKALKSM